MTRLVMTLLFAATPLFGHLISPQSLVNLQRTADAIVVGTATGSAPILSLEVNRIVKGDPAQIGKTLAVSWLNASDGMNPPQPVARSGNGLWFQSSISAPNSNLPELRLTP